jgi:DNA polymerase-1
VRRVVLVDGSSLIFRAYYAVPAALATASGIHTNASFGFALMFRKLFAGKKPDYGAVVFDSPHRTFREEKFPAYKAHRAPMPAELAEQLPWIDLVVEKNRFPLLRFPGYEADDVIGTLTDRAVAAGMEVLIVSADKDFVQLLGPDVRMIDTLRDVTYDVELARKKWGIRPEQMVDLLALMGDESDGIPGVPGIGHKGAAQLLEQYGSLDGLLANAASVKGRAGKALVEHRDQALLSRDLATIDRRVPVDVALEDLAIVAPDRAEVNALYKELQFYSLLDEEARAEAAGPTPGRTAASVDEARALVAGLPAGPVAAFPVAASLPFGPIVGIAFAAGDDAFHLPGELWREARALLEDAARPKVAHDAKRLWQLLRAAGVDVRGVAFDTMLASFLVEPVKCIPHRPEQLAKEYLVRALPKELDPIATVRAVAELHPILAAKLAELPCAGELDRLELPLAYVLGQMELDGVKVDRAEMQRIGVELAAELTALEARVHAAAGRPFNIGSPKQLGTVLFDELKLPVIKKTKTGWSTDQEVLERLAAKHDIARLVVEHRRIAKLINTYTDVLVAALRPDTGRVHANFQQTTSATGRLISTDPDLQRTPVRTPEGKRIRRAFVADPGNVIVSADWSQIELRVLAHVSADPLLVDSFRRGVDVHRRTASEIFHKPMDAVTADERGIGKTINFATIYGQGATALAQNLGIARGEAQAYIDGYFASYAGVRAWLDRTIADAHATGRVTTLFGRHRIIPELSSRNPIDRMTGERIAANTPIQGSAADLCKQAMVDIARRLAADGLRARMVMQIHDELVFEAPAGEADRLAALVKDAMENVRPLAVPLVADVGVGASWAEAKE